jgi:hypothetical protein
MQEKDGFDPRVGAVEKRVRSEVRGIASEMGGLEHPGLEELPSERLHAPEGDCGIRGDDDNRGSLQYTNGEWQDRDFGPEDNSVDLDHGCSGPRRY